jgi:hypothetical protein
LAHPLSGSAHRSRSGSRRLTRASGRNPAYRPRLSFLHPWITRRSIGVAH